MTITLSNIKFYVIILLSTGFVARGCDPRYFGEDSFVCVCTELSCDSFPNVISPANREFAVIKSSRDAFRFDTESGSLQFSNDTYQAYARMFVNLSDTRQTMLGFGGAFTDATGLNVAKLSLSLQDTFVRQYFSSDGLEYNIGRIPIGGSDFSTRPYSYDDVVGDTDLVFFNLTVEDHLYKIPLIQRAMQLNTRQMYFFGSPWAPPSWMKTNGMVNGSGSLLPEMQQPWANYFVKFLDAYAANGINIWGLTVQNEPMAGFDDWAWNCCYFSPEMERDFVRDYLGPALVSSGYDSVILMVGDDQRASYPSYIQTILDDPQCAQYVDGIAVHWYSDYYTDTDPLDQLHDLFPTYFQLYTEACNGFQAPEDSRVLLGSWQRGENYASDILDDVNHWSTGWTDWNMALDITGGPNWASNELDSPILINETANEFYKQPMFYVMGHFSKLIPNGSQNLGVSLEVFGLPVGDKGGLNVAAFRHPLGYIVAVALNTNEDTKTLAIEDSSGNLLVYDLSPRSIQTFYYSE